ncbi:hypothetical protein B0A52_01583 [Exophiala mesophila]|uniref:Major facilitator superfamily (MFS) profile domain-containing protein n=1 Tax=Exophiala mesophila TaxID=212818 RepID=A0A438NFE7_EXOME|nr:hypothetical protein B0A52_01583 [Exophiala mesophila]
MDSKDEETGETSQVIERYSVFTTPERWYIVILASFAAWFSSVNNFVYYPAMPLLASTFNVSIDKINLTVTSFIAVATIAPTLAAMLPTCWADGRYTVSLSAPT